MQVQFFAKMDFNAKASGRSKPHYGLASLTFDPQGGFLHVASVSLAPRTGNMRPLNPLLKQGLASLCS